MAFDEGVAARMPRNDRRWAVRLTLAILIMTGSCRRTPHDDSHRPPGYPIPGELFSIQLPADVSPDSDLGTPPIDHMPGEPDHCSGWGSRRSHIRWCWWYDGRRAISPCLVPGWSIHGRCYWWKHQLLTIDVIERESPDSLDVQRLLASVKFEPKGRWR
jgi:hypothetical protein